jgi:hypothetical protein
MTNATSGPARQEVLRADQMADRLRHLRDELRLSLQWAQAKQAEYANEDRIPAPQFKVGDEVFLDTRNIRTTRPNKSLDYKNRGPFKIVRVINSMAYELHLPGTMGRVHNVFHPWLLHLHNEAPLPGQTRDAEEPAEIDPNVEDDADYAVEAIEDCRINNSLTDPHKRGRNKKGLLQYKVRWSNYPEGPDNPTWEPYMNLVDSSEAVYEYHQSHPDKPSIHDKFKSLAEQQDLMLVTLVYSADQRHRR